MGSAIGAASLSQEKAEAHGMLRWLRARHAVGVALAEMDGFARLVVLYTSLHVMLRWLHTIHEYEPNDSRRYVPPVNTMVQRCELQQFHLKLKSQVAAVRASRTGRPLL